MTASVDVSLVVPLYNEEGSLPHVVAAIHSALALLPQEYEVIFVDDGSRDRTLQLLHEACAQDLRLKFVRLRRNYGQTTALHAGFQHASGAVIVTLDGDLQNDPRDIPLLLAKLGEGYDVVSGWRSDRQDEALRRNLPSVLANRLISAVTGVRLHDFGCTLKAYRRDILAHVSLYGEMHRFLPIYAVLAGARLAEVPVRHHKRLHGRSKYGLERVFKVLCDLLVVVFLQRFSQKPMYLFGFCGAVSLGSSALTAVAALYFKFFGHKQLVETPLPLIATTLFVTGVLCLLIGLVAELSIRIYHESQDKPTYLVAVTGNLESAPTAAAEHGAVAPSSRRENPIVSQTSS